MTKSYQVTSNVQACCMLLLVSLLAACNSDNITFPANPVVPSQMLPEVTDNQTSKPVVPDQTVDPIIKLLANTPSQIPDVQADDVLFIPPTIPLKDEAFVNKQDYPPYMGGTIINPRLTTLDDSEQFTRHVSFLTPKRIEYIDSSMRNVYYEGKFTIPDGAVNFNLLVFASSNDIVIGFDSIIDPNDRDITKSYIELNSWTLQNGGPVVFGPGKDFHINGRYHGNYHAAGFSPLITADVSNNKSKEVIVPGVWRFTFTQLVHKHSISHARVVLTIKNKNLPTDRLLLRPLSYENNEPEQISKYIESINQTYKLLNISTEILPLRNIGDKAPTNIENLNEAIELMRKKQLSYPDITPEQLSFVSLGLKGSISPGIAGVSSLPGMQLISIPQRNDLWGFPLADSTKPNKFASPRNPDSLVVVHEMLHFLGLGHTREFISVDLTSPPEGLIVMGKSHTQICAQYNAHFLSKDSNSITCVIDDDGIRDTSITLDTINVDFNIMKTIQTGSCYQAKSLLNNTSYKINLANYRTLCSAAIESDIYYDLTDIQKEIIKNSMMYHSLPAMNDYSIGMNDYKKYQQRIDAVDDGRYYRHEPAYSEMKADDFDCIITENKKNPCLLPLPTTITKDFINPEFSISVNDKILIPPANISPHKGRLINGQVYINVDFQSAPYRYGSTNITLTISNNSQVYSSSVYALLVNNTPDIPSFTQPSYEFDISYNSSKDDLVGVTEVVYREDETLTYNLSEDYELFKVNGTGSVTLLRDIGSQYIETYNLTLSAIEPISSRTTSTNITINIVNFPPEFIGTPYIKTIHLLDSTELAPTSNLVRVTAIDRESTDAPSYTLMYGDGFSISDEGNISTPASLSVGRYEFNVVATDSQGTKSTTKVIIKISDIQDADNDGVADLYDSVPDDPLLIVNGSGTAANPYMISNIYQLQAISGFDHRGNYLPNSKFVNYQLLFGADQIEQLGKYYLLSNNINASETQSWNPITSSSGSIAKSGFLPIGFEGCVFFNSFDCLESSVLFYGRLDGAGFTIDSLYINRPADANIGLFGKAEDAIITSLNIINANITGENNVGTLVGHSNRNIIKQVAVNGIIRGENSNTGALVGLQDNGLIDSSNSTGEVHAEEYVGGLVGRQRGGLIISSHSSSKVSGELIIGGLIGGQEPGAVQFSYAMGNVTGDDEIGGLIGYQEDGEVLASYATGIVHRQGTQNTSVGGLIGEQNSGSIISSYFAGNISANSAQAVGTMVGKHEYEISEIRGSYAKAKISIAGIERSDIGLVGLLPTGSSGNVIDSYWDNGNTGTSGIGAVGMGIGLRTEQITGCGLDGTHLFLTPITTSCNDNSGNIIFPSSNWGNVSMEHATGLREAGTIRYGWIFEPHTESPFLFAEDENGNSLMPSPQQQLCQRNHLHNCSFAFYKHDNNINSNKDDSNTDTSTQVPGMQETNNTGEPIFSASSIVQLLSQEPSQIQDNQTDDVLFIPPTISLTKQPFSKKQNYPPYMGGTTINPQLTVLDDSGQFTRHVSFLNPKHISNRRILNGKLDNSVAVTSYEGEFTVPAGAVNFNVFAFGSSNAYSSWFQSMIDPNGRDLTKAFINHYTRTFQNGGPVIFGPSRDYYLNGIFGKNNYVASFSPLITADIGNKKQEIIIPGVWKFTFTQLAPKHSISHARVVLTIKNKNMPTDRLLIRPLSYENNPPLQINNTINSVSQVYKLLNISSEILPLRNIGDKAPNIRSIYGTRRLMQQRQMSYPDITPEQLSFVTLGQKGSLPGVLGFSSVPGMHLAAISQPNNLWGLVITRDLRSNKFASPRNSGAQTIVHETLHFLGLGHTASTIVIDKTKPPLGLTVTDRSNEQICAQYNAHFLEQNSADIITCVIDTDGIKGTDVTSLIGGEGNIMDARRGGISCFLLESLVNDVSYGINLANYRTLCSESTEDDYYYHLTDIQREIVKNSMMYHSLPAINNNSIGVNDYKKYQQRIDAVDDGRYYRPESTHSGIKEDDFDCVIAENQRTPCLLPLPATITKDFLNPEFSVRVNDKILVPPTTIYPNKGGLINGQAYINIEFLPAPHRHGSTTITLTLSNNSQVHSSSYYSLLVKNTPDIPRFTQRSYEFDISYNSSHDDLVGIVQTIYHEDETLRYILRQEDELFKVNNTGSITLLRDIGTQDIGTYNLTLNVTEPISSRTTSTKITINVVNFPPEFIGAPYTKIIYVLDGKTELTPTSNLVRIMAIDHESTNTLSYTLIGTNGFSISEEGNISTQESLSVGRYKFNVVATDSQGANSTAKVIIDIKDLKDTDEDGIADIYDSAPKDSSVTINGDGTADRPYIINNIYQLQAVSGFDHRGDILTDSGLVNYQWLFGASQSEQLGKYYLLGNNINASETQNWNPITPNSDSITKSGFRPIGYNTCHYEDYTCLNKVIQFSGKLDGAGFTIDSLYINRPEHRSIGLFGRTYNAIITSLNIVNINVTGRNSVGMLVGIQVRGTIAQSSVNGIIRGMVNVGGMVGHQNNGIIDSSNSAGKVSSISYTGGLVGRQVNGIIISSHSTSRVIGRHTIGGLIGSKTDGTLQFSYATGTVIGSHIIGGLIGEELRGKVIASYSTGKVHQQGGYYYDPVGGLIGAQDSASMISSSYFAGNISANSAGAVGAIVGKHRDEVSEIRGSYANAKVSIAGTVRNDIGLVGLLPTGSSGNITDSYWDNGDTGIIGMGIGLRTEQITGCGLDGNRLFLTPITISCNDNSGNVIFPTSNWGNVSMEYATGIREAGTIRYGWIFEPPMESPFLFAEDENGNSLMPSPQQQLCHRNHLHNCSFSF